MPAHVMDGMKLDIGKGVIVLGSARADGNTGLVASQLAKTTGFEIIDLSSLNIGYFDYLRANSDDDFLSTIEFVLGHDVIVFATPVYWYSMSAVMKTFLDRFSDLLKWHKETGRRLRGKKMVLVSTSEKRTMNPVFSFPFEQTASYLGMDFLGYIHCPTKNGELPVESTYLLEHFTGKIMRGDLVDTIQANGD